MVKRFDLVLVKFGETVGSEQSSTRPAVVVSNEMSCMYSPVIIVMPFTTNLCKTEIPTHHVITAEPDGLKRDSLLLGEQPTPVDRRRIVKTLGHISSDENKKRIDKACVDAFFYDKGRSK